MKVGDLVKHGGISDSRTGLVVKLVEKKCWRTGVLGRKVEWGKIDPEPHAVVLIGGNRVTIPVADLELLDERG